MLGVRDFINEYLEERRKRAHAEGRAEGLAKGLAEGRAKGLAEGRAKAQSEFDEWCKRWKDAQDSGEPFDEPPPGSSRP